MATVLLQAERLHKSYGPHPLFEDLHIHILEGEKSALIAPNGSGKSSLLHILAGAEPPESGGSVFLHPGTTIGYLPQEPVFNPQHTLIEAVNVIDNHQEHLIKKIFTQLRMDHLGRLVGALSGGERKRLALARLLLHQPKLLILDEPTNHLDIEMIEWLEEYIKRSRSTLLMVTHDRYFLDRICNRIYELDRGKLYTYQGNYTYYLGKREERITQQQTETERARNLLRTELEWMRSTPQARTGKAKYRINAFYDLAQRASPSHNAPQLRIHVQTARLGKKIIECKNVCHAYGKTKTLEDFNYAFSRMEKIGIVGNNGVGKTTLLNILTGKTEPTSGEIILGETIRFGYYTQQGLSFTPDQKVIDIVRQIAETITLGNGKQLSAGEFLQYFLFPPDQHYTYVEKLSGGEKRRLYLLTILMRQPNFLILDEPTNDLDIMTLNVLEEYLQSFPGCVLIVSHDRHFIDKVADHLFVFLGDGKVKDFTGDYSQYRLFKKEQEEPKPPKAPKSVKSSPSTSITPKRSFKEQREMEQLESQLAALEQEKAQLEAQLSSGALTPEALHACSQHLASVLQAIDTKSDRWLQIADLPL